MFERKVSYAQNREDVILSAFFSDLKKGFYVDVGAHHPIDDSVTKFFYDKGWRGINIEPNKKFFDLIQKDRPRDINLNVGIADTSGKLIFREYLKGDGLSTFSNDMKEQYECNATPFTEEFRDSEVEVITLKQLADQNHMPTVNFLKIDIEGFEYAALSGNDWTKFRPEVICIEANHVIDDWRPLVKRHGYELIFDDGLNEYYAIPERAKQFSYVKNAISKDTLYFEDHNRNQDLLNAIKKIDYLQAKQAMREHELLREIVYRDTIIAQSHRIRAAARLFLKAIDNLFIVQINRLNHPVRKHVSKSVSINENYADLNASRLLRVAAENDLENYYRTDKGNEAFSKPILYNITWFLYRGTRKASRTVLRSLYRVVKSIRKRTT